MKSLFRKSLTLALVAVLMSLMVSCAHSAGNGTTAAAGEGTSGAAGESTPAAAGEDTSSTAAGEGLTASEKDPQTGNGEAGEETHIVILATSDMHGNVWGYTYEDYAESSNNGMARLYTYIKQVREENPVVFLIDGGDNIQGTIMTDDIANKLPDSEHPVMAAINFMGYDSMTLGNHEFKSQERFVSRSPAGRRSFRTLITSGRSML